MIRKFRQFSFVYKLLVHTFATSSYVFACTATFIFRYMQFYPLSQWNHYPRITLHHSSKQSRSLFSLNKWRNPHRRSRSYRSIIAPAKIASHGSVLFTRLRLENTKENRITFSATLISVYYCNIRMHICKSRQCSWIKM